MSVFLNKNFTDMLSALSAAGADFLIVGAHALSFHGYPRATGDLDIWVRPTEENAEKVWRALDAFGAPRRSLSPADFHAADTVYQIGVPPQRIDIMTAIDGVDFAEAWNCRAEKSIEGLQLGFLSRDHLLKNKRATGRPKDLFDAAWLEESDE